MPIILELIREGRTLLQTYNDPVDSAQMHELRTKMDTEILPAATGKLHIIADFRNVSNLPRTILMTGRSWLREAHPNTGTIIGVVNGGFVQSMAHVFGHFRSKQSFIVAASMEDALTKIDALLAVHDIVHP